MVFVETNSFRIADEKRAEVSFTLKKICLKFNCSIIMFQQQAERQRRRHLHQENSLYRQRIRSILNRVEPSLISTPRSYSQDSKSIDFDQYENTYIN